MTPGPTGPVWAIARFNSTFLLELITCPTLDYCR